MLLEKERPNRVHLVDTWPSCVKYCALNDPLIASCIYSSRHSLFFCSFLNFFSAPPFPPIPDHPENTHIHIMKTTAQSSPSQGVPADTAWAGTSSGPSTKPQSSGYSVGNLLGVAAISSPAATIRGWTMGSAGSESGSKDVSGGSGGGDGVGSGGVEAGSGAAGAGFGYEHQSIRKGELRCVGWSWPLQYAPQLCIMYLNYEWARSGVFATHNVSDLGGGLFDCLIDRLID